MTMSPDGMGTHPPQARLTVVGMTVQVLVARSHTYDMQVPGFKRCGCQLWCG